MKRLPGTPPTPTRQRHVQSPHENDDIDLSELIKEREGRQELGGRRPHVAGRRPANRTGGRIRMDVAKSTASGPRQIPVPGAPKYKPNTKPRNWGTTILKLLLVIVAMAGVVYAFTTPKLAIRDIEIDGVSAATAESLQNQITVDPLGRNLLAYVAMHGRALQRQMAGAQPDFAAAHIGISLPGTLRIMVDMRKPYALLVIGPTRSGGMYVLDERGMPIEDSQNSPKDLVKIIVPQQFGSDLQDSTISLGHSLPGSIDQSVRDAFAAYRETRGNTALADVTSIQLDKSGNLGLNMANHLRVKLGQPVQMSAKLGLVNSLLTEHPDLASEAQYIDVSSPARPAMMPKPVPNTNTPVTAISITESPVP